MVTSDDLGRMGMQKQLDALVPPPTPTPPMPQGRPPMSSMPQGRPPMPQGRPPMPQGRPSVSSMPQGGLPGVASAPDFIPTIGGVAMAALLLTSKKTQNIIDGMSGAAQDRNVTLPSNFSEESGGLMRLAAAGGPVMYRREGGIATEEQKKQATREELLAKMKETAEKYGYYDNALDVTKRLSFTNNPIQEYEVAGDSGDMADRSYLVGDPRQYHAGTFTPQPGLRARYGMGNQFGIEYQGYADQLEALDNQPTEKTSSTFVPIEDDRYGSINDPNLPAMDAATQRLLYRQNVGYYEQPPGPTVNTERLLNQAYGKDSPIVAELLTGLRPAANPRNEATAMQAFYNLPGSNYEVPTEEVNAAGGGGLYELAAGGEFSGRVPGDGGGMQDNVRMPIKEGADQVATLAVSPTEYVVDSHTMAALGNGNPDKGADYMDDVVKGIRSEAYGTTKQPKEIDGLSSLKTMMG